MIVSGRNSKKADILILTIGVFLFSYTTYRAAVLSFTWDEAYSYLQYVRKGVLFPSKYEQMDANNHLLNTWLNIHLVDCFGVSEFVLRIPSLFAHILFLFFSFKLVRDFQNKWLVIASFLIINLNPYILDFFSLSRGYAPSLGFMMTSIYFLYVWVINEQKIKYAILCCLTGALASSANFVLLNYFIVSFGLILLMTIYTAFINERKLSQKTIQLLKTIAIPLLIVLLSLGFLIPIAFKLKAVGALFYGGKTGFWTDTFCTITDRCFYELGYNYWFQRAAKGFAILIMILGSYFVATKLIRKQQNSKIVFLSVLLLLLLLCAFSTVVQHYLFGTLYLIDRTAMFLAVLFSLVLVFFVNELVKENARLSIISYSAGLFAVFHFILSFNLHYVLEWKSNADVKQMLSDLSKVKVIPKEKKNITICIPLSFDQSINYYRAVNHLTWINTVERSKTADYLYDYLYLEPGQYDGIVKDSIAIIKTYPITNNVLAKPKQAPGLTKTRFLQQLDYEKTAEGKYILDDKVEYAQGFNYVVNDSITPDRNAEVVFTATVLSSEFSKCDLDIVISFENKKGVYVWKRAYIQDWITKADKWEEVSFTCVVPAKTVAGDELKSYIWNPNKQKLFVTKMEFKWLSKP